MYGIENRTGSEGKIAIVVSGSRRVFKGKHALSQNVLLYIWKYFSLDSLFKVITISIKLEKSIPI